MILKYKWVGVDSFYHLFIAGKIKKEKRLPELIDSFFVPEKYAYPPLFHVLLSFFKTTDSKIQFIGPLIEVANTFLLFIMGLMYFDEHTAIFAVTIYTFVPMMLEISGTANPRALGNLFVTLSTFFFLLFFSSQMILGLVLSMVFGSFIFLTHRLTLQSWIFSMIVLSIWFASIFPIFLILGGLLLAILLSKGFYIRVLKGHLNMILFRVKHGSEFQKKGLLDIKSLIFNFPLVIITPVLLYYSVARDIFSSFFLAWALSSILLAFLWIIGEGHRHLTNGMLPLSMLFAIFSKNNIVIFITFFVISAIFCLFKMWMLKNYVISNDLLDCFRFLNSKMEKKDLILCLPTVLSYSTLFFVDDARLFHGSGGDVEGTNFNVCFLRPMIEKQNVKELVRKFNLKWIIDYKRNVKNNMGIIVFQSGDACVYRVKSGDG